MPVWLHLSGRSHKNPVLITAVFCHRGYVACICVTIVRWSVISLWLAVTTAVWVMNGEELLQQLPYMVKPSYCRLVTCYWLIWTSSHLPLSVDAQPSSADWHWIEGALPGKPTALQPQNEPKNPYPNQRKPFDRGGEEDWFSVQTPIFQWQWYPRLQYRHISHID